MVQQNKIYDGRVLHVPCHSSFIGARTFLPGRIATGTVYECEWHFPEDENKNSNTNNIWNKLRIYHIV